MKILIVDQLRSMRNVLTERLQYEGHSIQVAETYELAFEKYGSVAPESIDLIICDDTAFMEWIGRHDRLRDEIYDVIVVAKKVSLESAIKFVRAGAIDYLSRPLDFNQLLERVDEIEQGRVERGVLRYVEGREKRVEELVEKVGVVDRGMGTKQVVEPTGKKVSQPEIADCLNSIVGDSKPIETIKSLITRVAPSEARVMIFGDNGTGKELVAKALHKLSRRKNAPFIEVNCAAIPAELIESELFGHEKGAFTSAIRQRKGKFELANGGTLFLDEIGDMSLSAQAKVLRVLEEDTITRVGGDAPIDVDVRVIAATNKDLQKKIDKDEFRIDLYHRLSVIVLQVPSLVERREDIPLLIDYFLGEISKEYNIDPKEIDVEAIDTLIGLPWRGNVRELRNVVERLIVLCDEKITKNDVESYVVSV